MMMMMMMMMSLFDVMETKKRMLSTTMRMRMMIMMAAMARMALRALTCDRKTTETVREEKMDAAGTGPLTILGGLPSIKNPLVVKKN